MWLRTQREKVTSWIGRKPISANAVGQRPQRRAGAEILCRGERRAKVLSAQPTSPSSIAARRPRADRPVVAYALHRSAPCPGVCTPCARPLRYVGSADATVVFCTAHVIEHDEPGHQFQSAPRLR